jgi:hypothetical protein
MVLGVGVGPPLEERQSCQTVLHKEPYEVDSSKRLANTGKQVWSLSLVPLCYSGVGEGRGGDGDREK